MMKGAIDFLTSDEPHACMLRSKFVFKIVPMLNPDGVVVGNYRCSLAGQDLNRNWLTPTKFAHPTLHYTKMMMRRLISDRPVLVAVDLHGHSRKQNIFMYGVDPLRRLNPRVFPRMLDDCAPGFTFNNCSFRVSRSKLATARAVWANELGLVNGYTMEASFAGADVGDLKGVQFTARDLEDMGVQFCMNILRFSPFFLPSRFAAFLFALAALLVLFVLSALCSARHPAHLCLRHSLTYHVHTGSTVPCCMMRR
jgi:hypothetical protein